MNTTAEDAMAHAALHLRMVLLGQSSYSASVTEVDRGYARLLLAALQDWGFDLVPTDPPVKVSKR